MVFGAVCPSMRKTWQSCSRLLSGFMLIRKLHPTCIKAGIYTLALEMVSVINYIKKKKWFLLLSRLKGRTESGYDKIQYDSAVQLFVQPAVLIMQSYVCSGTQSICTHSEMLTKTLLQRWKVLTLTQTLWGSTGKRNKVSTIKSYTHVYSCKFTPPLLFRSDNFVVVHVLNKQRGRSDVCSQRHACFCSQRSICFLSGEKASSYGGLKEERISWLWGIWDSNQSVIDENPSLSQREVTFVSEFKVCSFIAFVAKSHRAHFFHVTVSILFPLGEVKKEKSLDYVVSLSLNLKLWCR